MTTPSAPRPTDPVAADACGTCGEPLTTDPRFVRWCPACGWNAYPNRVEARRRGDRFRRRLNRDAERRLYRRVVEGGSAPQATAVGAYALAGLVHLVTLGVGVTGVVLLVGTGWPAHVVGVVLVGLSVLLRPRLGPGRRVRRRLLTVRRADAPALYGVADRVAAELGTAAPALIVIDGSYNASYRREGLRRRVVLTLGLPLWETLDPGQRLALLAHELGHGANGDARSGLWIGSAISSLEEWYRVFRPGAAPGVNRRMQYGARVSRASGFAAIGEMIAMVVMGVFAELTILVNRLLTRLTLLSGRRAEYRADAMAARIAGPEAAARMLSALALGSAAEQVAHRRELASTPKKGAPRPDFWSDLREYVASIPPSERDRRLRVCELDDSAVDTSHPPTHLRLAYVRQLPAAEPSIALTEDELSSIDAELAATRRKVGQYL
jgi:Zn-dependent protease with chaperone function